MPHPRFLWPVSVVVGAATDVIVETPQNFRFDEGGGELTAVIPAGEYFIRGGGVGATDLLATLATQMNAVAANTYSVTVSTTGTVTIARTAGAAVVNLRWLTGTGPRFDGTVLGYDVTADDNGATSYASDFQHRFGWYPEQHLIDGARRIETATAGAARSLGQQQYTQQWATDYRVPIRVDYVPMEKVRYRNVDAGVPPVAPGPYEPLTSTGQVTWEGLYEALRRGTRFEFMPDTTGNRALFDLLVVDPDEQGWFEDFEECADLQIERGERYQVVIPARPYVA